MIVAAITGSIGCGKTTLAKLARELGYTVFDIDAWVRRLYFDKIFLQTLNENFHGIVNNGEADKRALRNIVFADNKKLKLLESLIHPFLRQKLKQVIRRNAFCDDVFFIDVALLFEMGWDKYCDIIIVADVDPEVQKKRVMMRDKVSAEDFERINNVQINNEHKKMLADIVIDTDKPKNLLKVDLINIIKGLEA